MHSLKDYGENSEFFEKIVLLQIISQEETATWFRYGKKFLRNKMDGTGKLPNTGDINDSPEKEYLGTVTGLKYAAKGLLGQREKNKKAKK